MRGGRYDAAVITGATSGVGEAFARALPAGTALLLAGRDSARLAALADALARPGRRIETRVGDLTRAEDRMALIARASDFAPDLLINNAGFGVFGPALDNPAEQEQGMVEVNALAPLALTRTLAPAMIGRAQTAGRRCGVIFVSSVVAFAPLPLLGTYAATKAFVSRYAEALAEELRDAPIDILDLRPGATKTRFHDRSGADFAGPMDSPERVAREGLAALGRRVTHVVNPRNRAAGALMAGAPRGLFLRLAAKAQQRRAS